MEIIRNFELFLLIASYIRVWIAITIIGLTFRLPPPRLQEIFLG